jgi:predicted protein tyrosine phosphatase
LELVDSVMEFAAMRCRHDGPTWSGRRRPVGVPLVRVMGDSEVRDARASRAGVVIAIRAPGARVVPLRSGWHAVLEIEVPDVDVYGNLGPGADVSPAAREIAAFLRAHHDAPSILVHCRAGLSRSRSVAAALCESRGWPYAWTVLHQPLHDAVAEALQSSPR